MKMTFRTSISINNQPELTPALTEYTGRPRSGQWARTAGFLPETLTEPLFRQGNEVFKQLQPNCLALFRVKLRRVDVVLPDGGRERLAISGPRGDDRRIFRPREKAVHEIHVTAGLDSAKERAFRAGDFDLVPTNLRHF